MKKDELKEIIIYEPFITLQEQEKEELRVKHELEEKHKEDIRIIKQMNNISKDELEEIEKIKEKFKYYKVNI